jgi:hypothetical protein
VKNSPDSQDEAGIKAGAKLNRLDNIKEVKNGFGHFDAYFRNSLWLWDSFAFGLD